MRISDWSSDLCSSDLPGAARERIQPGDDSTVSRRPPKPDPRPDPRSGPRPDPRPDPRIEIREKTTAFKGYFQVDRYRLRHRKLDGDWTAQMTREAFERGHAAAALLHDPPRDRGDLPEQLRPRATAAGLEDRRCLVSGTRVPGRGGIVGGQRRTKKK